MTQMVIMGGGGNGRPAKVTADGELVVGDLAYSDVQFQDVDTIDTAFNFFKPTTGKRRIITGILVATDRNVGVNGAVVEIYEATAADTATVAKTVIRLDVAKSTTLPIFGVKFLTAEGAFINGKTDDASAFVTVAGYEIDA